MAFCGVLSNVLAHAVENCKNAPVSLCPLRTAGLILIEFLKWFKGNQIV
jgi:hypothetical protein